MAKCLVTGGAGFIGSHIVEELARSGHETIALDDLSTGSRANLDAVGARLRADRVESDVRLVEGSTLDREALDRLFPGVDCVFHQSALPSVAFSVAEPLLSHRSNTEGTLNVLLAARDAGVRRVVYAGSSSAYGANPILPKHEDLPLLPLSPYATAKLTGENYCRVFHHIDGLETIVLRYFNVFGPRQSASSAYAAVVPLFMTALLEGRPLRIFGDGHQSRDFTYVDNVVQANLLAMHSRRAVGRVMNIANGSRTSLLELISILEGLSGATAELRFEAERAGDVKHSQADITRASELLGYSPKVSVQKGLESTFEFFEAGGTAQRCG